MTRFTPYISFPGNAEEMLTFYHSVFGGDLQIQRYDDMDTSGFPFTPPAGAVAHATLRSDSFSVCGGDDCQPESEPFNRGNLSFLLEPETTDEAERLINALTADGGKVTMPFAQAPWGDFYGQADDKFGMAWQFSVSPK